MWRGYWRFLLPYRIGRCYRRAFAHSCPGARQEFDRFFLCEEQHRVLDAILHFLHSRSEEHTSELQSQSNLVCRLLLEKKKNNTTPTTSASSVHFTPLCRHEERRLIAQRSHLSPSFAPACSAPPSAHSPAHAVKSPAAM